MNACPLGGDRSYKWDFFVIPSGIGLLIIAGWCSITLGERGQYAEKEAEDVSGS